MNQLDFAYSVAYIRAIENKLLTKTETESLISAKNAEEVLSYIRDKGYTLEESDDFEDMLKNAKEKLYETVKEVLPENADLDLFLLKNDFHNIKAAVKCVFAGLSYDKKYFLYPNTENPQKLFKAVQDREFSYVKEEFSRILKECCEILGKTKDSQLLDTVADSFYTRLYLKKARDSQNGFPENFVLLENTLTGIKIAVRCAKTKKDADFVLRALPQDMLLSREGLSDAVLQGEARVIEYIFQNGMADEADALKISASEYEKYKDERLLKYLASSKYQSFGIEPLIYYIYSKETEIKNLRIILLGKKNGFPREFIEDKIRNCF